MAGASIKSIMNKDNHIIPVVHESRAVRGDGILTDRQKAWMNGPPNNVYLENPVLYRKFKEDEAEKNAKSLSYKESINIRGISSEKEESPKQSSGILEKIQGSRKERHEAAIEEMIQELAGISLELEPQIEEICLTMKGYLAQDSDEIEQTISPILDDNLLVTYSLDDLYNIWHSVEQHSSQRTTWINELHDHLDQIEQKRSALITAVLKSYTQTLERIAHLMPGDVHRLMEDEIMTINNSIVDNQQASADLVKRLLIADIENEKKLYVKFQNRIDDWKEFKLEEHVKRHREFMESESIAHSPVLKRYINDLVCQQTSLNKRRVELLTQLREMRPPASTKPAVFQWNQAVTNITDQLDQVHNKYTSLIKVEQEKILYQCDEYMVDLERELFNQGIANEEIIEELFNEKFRPAVGERKSIFEYEMERLTKHLQEVMAHQKQHLKHLFRYAHGAAGVWDLHELGLAKEERALQEMLDKNRKDHDYQNQMKEAKLDIVIDRMRQGSNEEVLSTGLKQALVMMEELKKGYHDFHSTQKLTCEKYPRMVKDELERYGSAITSYFNVVDNSQLKEMPDREVIKVIKLSNGTLYNLLDCIDEPSSASTFRSSINPQSIQGAIDPNVPLEVFPYVESFVLPDKLFDDLKHSMCVEFLEHLEMWSKDILIRANAAVSAKVEEINNELDLRLHLHGPRPGRAENDVHQVRISELTLHRERVLQHCTGVDESLDELKKSFQKMIEEHLKENEMFKNSVEELEMKFADAGNTYDLKVHQDEVHGKLDQYMDVIRASVRHFRYDLDNMLNKLRNSNADFRKAMRIFSEGGNFSPEEVDEYRKNLEKVASKIDACEGTLVGELEGMETKRMEIARECAGKLEERFKQHLFDLSFIEKIKRWLTNIQVKIKAEVANSNSQSQHLSKMISVFSRRVDVIKSPSPDDEEYAVESLHETLVPLISSTHKRVMYLNCAVSKESYNNNLLQDTPSTAESPKDNPRTPKSTTKRKRYVKKGSPGTAVAQRSLQALKTDNQNQDKQIIEMQGEKKGRKESKGAREGTKEVGAMQENLELSRGSSLSMSTGNKAGVVRTQFGGKYDKRYLVFGENTGETEPEQCFLPLQLRIIQSGLDGLLSTAELYYRQKGSRSATRPQSINENFDSCADALTKRLRKYKEQTETFHNESVQEFRAQIRLFISCVEQLPHLLMVSLVKRNQDKYTEKSKEIQLSYDSQRKRIEKRKRDHQTLLRPTLGHPNNHNEFKKLCSAETSRQVEAAEMISNFESVMKETVVQNSEDFMHDLQDYVSLLMSQFDSLVTVNDIIEGIPKIQQKSEKELIRDKLLRRVKEQNTDDNSADPTNVVWPGILSEGSISIEFVAEKAEEILHSVTSTKKTLSHEAVIKARDDAFMTYCKMVISNHDSLSSHCGQARSDERRWIDNWNKSVEKIANLY